MPEQKSGPTKRAELKKLRKEEKQTDRKLKRQHQDKRKQRKQERNLNKTPRRRLIPIWVKVIIVLILASAALLVGLMVGYGILGDGNPTDALEIETWKKIIRIVIADE